MIPPPNPNKQTCKHCSCQKTMATWPSQPCVSPRFCWNESVLPGAYKFSRQLWREVQQSSAIHQLAAPRQPRNLSAHGSCGWCLSSWAGPFPASVLVLSAQPATAAKQCSVEAWLQKVLEMHLQGRQFGLHIGIIQVSSLMRVGQDKVCPQESM